MNNCFRPYRTSTACSPDRKIGLTSKTWMFSAPPIAWALQHPVEEPGIDNIFESTIIIISELSSLVFLAPTGKEEESMAQF